MIDLSLSEDQRQLVDSVTRMLADRAPLLRSRAGASIADVHSDLAKLGWFGVGIAERRGGLGLGYAEEALLFFEAGRFLLPPSVLATTLAAHLCPEADLPGLLDGGTRAALAIVARTGTFVFDRGDAQLLLALEGDRIWLAPANTYAGDVIAGFDETLVTERGAIDGAACITRAGGGRARLLTSAMLAGIARASTDLAVDHASRRVQFGQPIGAFQAIKHICADMGLRAYAAEAQIRMAAALADHDAGGASHQIDATALTALVSARRNAEDAIQVHGGIGFTAECDAHLYLKRAHLLGRAIGGLEACRHGTLARPASGGL